MLEERLDLSERRACQIIGQPRSTQRRPVTRGKGDDALRARLYKFSRKHKRWGYRKAWAVLRDEGWNVNHKKIQRLWREEGLKVPHRKRKRQRLGISTCPADRLRAERPNHVWGLDFQFGPDRRRQGAEAAQHRRRTLKGGARRARRAPH